MPGKTCDTMTHSTIPALRMTDVHKRFGDNEVLRGVSLQVAPGGSPPPGIIRPR